MENEKNNIDNFPEFIYQYRNFSEEHTVNNFKNSELHFGHVSKLNDPFEHRIKIILDTKDIKKLFDHWGKNNGYNSVNELKKALNTEEKKLKLENELQENYHRISLAMQNNVSCFTSVFDNKLMWAHYAGGHNGFCYKFDRKILQKSFAEKYNNRVVLEKVNYPPDNILPTLTIPTTYKAEINAIRKMLSTKSIDWEYEKEFRAIAIDNQSKQVILESIGSICNDKGEQIKIPEEALVAVYFGSKCSKEHRERIKIAIKETNYPKVKFYEMKPYFNRGKYEILSKYLFTCIAKKHKKKG